MEWHEEIEASREQLRRIVALLFRMAMLADFAAGQPLARLRYTLSILRPAEGFAWRCYVEGDYDGSSPRHAWELPGFMEVCDDDGPEDARVLAASLRFIACALAWCLLRTEGAVNSAILRDENAAPHLSGLNLEAALRPVAHRRDWLGPD